MSSLMCVHVSGLPTNLSAEELSDDMIQSVLEGIYAEKSVEGIRVVRDRETNFCKGYAFVNFSCELAAADYIRSVEALTTVCPSTEDGITSTTRGSPASSADSLMTATGNGFPVWTKSLRAQLSVPKASSASKCGGSKAKTTKPEEDLPDLRMRRKRYPGKAKHSVTCSDTSKMKRDGGGFLYYKTSFLNE